MKGSTPYKPTLDIGYPKIATEWNYKKNDGVPSDYRSSSGMKVWWICSQGHEWEAVIDSRTRRNYGCPYCSGRFASMDSSLSVTHPHLLKEWCYEKNVHIAPDKISQGSDKKVWWKCFKGHTWKVAVKHRALSKSGCPHCKPKTSKPEIRIYCELLTIFLDTKHQKTLNKNICDIYIPSLKLVVEYDGITWHKNRIEKDIAKNKRLESLGFKVIRIREFGLSQTSENDILISEKEELLQTIARLFEQIKNLVTLPRVLADRAASYVNANNFSNDTKYLEMTQHKIPELEKSIVMWKNLVEEWDYKKNYPFTPELYSYGSKEKVWWKCSKGHSWKSSISNRTGHYKTGCPECSGKQVGNDNNLAVRFPELAEEWDSNKNNTLCPTDVTPGNNRKVWWVCSKGHSWQAKISNRAYLARGCPHCYNERRRNGLHRVKFLQ